MSLATVMIIIMTIWQTSVWSLAPAEKQSLRLHCQKLTKGVLGWLPRWKKLLQFRHRQDTSTRWQRRVEWNMHHLGITEIHLPISRYCQCSSFGGGSAKSSSHWDFELELLTSRYFSPSGSTAFFRLHARCATSNNHLRRPNTNTCEGSCLCSSQSRPREKPCTKSMTVHQLLQPTQFDKGHWKLSASSTQYSCTFKQFFLEEICQNSSECNKEETLPITKPLFLLDEIISTAKTKQMTVL